MAKVKIQGHASGTGVFTVTAPNSNTDRTITLPDGDVTMGVGIDDNANATAITIDSSENVLIGKTTTALATVGLTLGESGFASITRDGYEPLNVNRLSSDGNVFSVYKDSVVKGSIAVTGSGIGIQLGGTDAAHTLEDYEEGTWTPTGTGFTISTVHSATYTKIGRQVTVVSYVTGTSGGSNTAAIAGLPFTNRSNGYSVGAVNVTAANPVRTNLLLRAETNSTSMTFYKDNDVVIPGTDVDSGHIIFTLTYFTDS